MSDVLILLLVIGGFLFLITIGIIIAVVLVGRRLATPTIRVISTGTTSVDVVVLTQIPVQEIQTITVDYDTNSNFSSPQTCTARTLVVPCTGLSANTQYYFRANIEIPERNLRSPNSATVTFTTHAQVTPSLTINQATGGNNAVTVTYAPLGGNRTSNSVKSYNTYVATSRGANDTPGDNLSIVSQTNIDPTAAVNFRVTGLRNNTTYYVWGTWTNSTDQESPLSMSTSVITNA